MSTPSTRATVATRLSQLGAAMVGLGVIATIVTLLPLLLDADPLPVVFYLLCFLAPLGLGVILVALWLHARDRKVPTSMT